jgi:hypothetical protein
MLINATCSYLQDHHDEMVVHIACLTGTTEDKVCKEFAGNYSILVPMLAGVTGPPSAISPPHAASPILQYPNRTEDKEDKGQWTLTYSLPLLMILPQTEEVVDLVTPPPVSPLPPYADLPFEGTDVPSPPDSPILHSTNSSPTDWSSGLDNDKENWAPQPHIHPGIGWEHNFECDLHNFSHALHHFFTIPNSKGGQELASFIQYRIKDPSPFLEACLGFNCEVFSCPLYTHPDQQYCVPLTPHQEWFFEPDQEHTPIVSWALHGEWDMTLTAEVHHA